ncbi:MAG: hypothetical protein JRN20_01255 [Nitrososphaerota archaeon]|nr:hypothetical protein [Nitrososphaerota archaeon]MDG6922038.1 hypothetical protein [Nitrososphaerota archaeon]
MATPRSIKVISVLILIVTIVGFAVLGVIGITGARTALSIKVGSPTSQVVGTAESISIPVSLSNPGPLSLNGIDVSLTFLDPNGTLLSTGGGGPLTLKPGSSGELPISVVFDMNQVPQAALGTLSTTNENLTLRATLSASVSSLTSFKGTFNIPYSWGAPISDLKIGTAQMSAYNATFARFSVPISFTDASQTFSVSGTIGGAIIDQSGNSVGTIEPQQVSVGTDSAYSGQLTGFIRSSAAGQSFTAQLEFQTSFGTFTKDVVLSA